MKTLLFGNNGQVGWELHRALLPISEIVALGRTEADFAKPESLRALVHRFRPDVIANCVAYTAVDKAESEETLAMRINTDAVKVLADEAKKLNSLLVHYSTDYVFDGTKRDPYTEEDTPHPLNAYGRSKLAGDAAIQASGCRHLIFRSSWIYGVRGGNFLLTMLRLAKERSELQIVNDQAGSPTWSRLLAQTTAFCVLKMHDAPEQGESLSGIYNLSCDGHTTWHGFASEIFRLAEMKNLCASPILRAVSTGDYPAAAQRPRQSRLDNGKLLSRFDISLPEWNHALQLCMDDLGAVRSTVQK